MNKIELQEVKEYLQSISSTGRDKGVGFCVALANLALAKLSEVESKDEFAMSDAAKQALVNMKNDPESKKYAAEMKENLKFNKAMKEK